MLGAVSLKRLGTCDPDLQRFVKALDHYVARSGGRLVSDIAVLCGFRGEREQNEAFVRGTSKLRWPDSKHNSMPARAVDIAPYPVIWKNRAQFEELRQIALMVAADIGVKLRIIDWDLPHFELA
jgi:peptidoglycan L-alanyl-D-glutamate endopeptidase CwlK